MSLPCSLTHFCFDTDRSDDADRSNARPLGDFVGWILEGSLLASMLASIILLAGTLLARCFLFSWILQKSQKWELGYIGSVEISDAFKKERVPSRFY